MLRAYWNIRRAEECIIRSSIVYSTLADGGEARGGRRETVMEKEEEEGKGVASDGKLRKHLLKSIVFI